MRESNLQILWYWNIQMLLIYFIIGFVYDILVTMYYQMIIGQKAIGTGILSFLVTVFQVLVIYSLILSPEMLGNAIAYALGCGCGAAFTVYYKRKKQCQDL